jgi:signal transduction histidine kinase
MAEVAAGVLHDVGNVLNSITVSSGLLKEQLGKKNINRVGKIAGLLRENENNLAEFLSRKKHGSNVIDYVEQLAQQLIDEQNFFSRELNALLNNVDHVNDIIHRQQSHAIPSSAKQNVNLNQVIDDVLKINNLRDQVHGISVQTELADIPSLYIDKHNLIQILNNLVSNAKQAFDGKTENPVIQIKTETDPQNETATITITDNGCGITKDNQARIFQFGFTTKEGGHGFGLYTSASAAQSMGGRLSFSSKGYGHGTSFMLTLPYKPGRSSKGEIAA